ncbi:hypothetical protein [Pseudoneobacillus sp. C159]
METSNHEVKRRIFRQELYKIQERGYLSEAIVETVLKAQHECYLDIEAEIRSRQELEKATRIETQLIKMSPPKPVKVKKERTPDETRERNITWLLNLGVIMLLIGGLFVATSNWESMSAMMKSGSIAGVSFLFYGFAFLAKRILKIEKTAFAFIVLGSLFLPIFVLSLGWFGLLGDYLAINGEGRYFLGVLGAILPLIVYLYFAKSLNSRLFVWFTYISLTIGVAFLFSGFDFPIDYFYLGMVLYNALLVFGFLSFKKQNRFPLFTNELIIFVQISLILTTLTMIFLYEQHVTNGFNILLTAVIYLAMIFVSGKKEYHFIFTAMIVYGAYQLIEYSSLETLGPVLFALLGVGFSLIRCFVPESLEKIFRITSAIISILAFMYISLEGLLLKMGEPSVVLLIAYFIIGSHFVFLGYQFKQRLFTYLSPVFYAATLFEGLALLDQYTFSIVISVEIFLVGFLLFLILGVARLYRKLGIIRLSSRDVGLVIMIFGILLASVLQHWGELAGMLLAMSLISYIIIKLEDRPIFSEISVWILPVTLGLVFVALGEEISQYSDSFNETLGKVGGLVAGSVFVLLSSYGWGKMGEDKLRNHSFFISQAYYTMAMLTSFVQPLDALWVKPAVLFGGIFVYLLLFKHTKFIGVPYLLASTSLIFYFTWIESVTEQWKIPLAVEPFLLTGGAFVHLLIALILFKKSQPLFHGFAWVGHIYLPLSLLITFFDYPKESIWSFLIAIIIYVLSLRLARVGWQNYLYLYAGYISLIGAIISGLNKYLASYQDYFPFILTSAIIALLWFGLNPFYKKSTMYFWVPFSLLGVLFCLNTWPFALTEFLMTIAYLVVILLFVHYYKWAFVPLLPLLLTFLAAVNFTEYMDWSSLYQIFMMAGMGIILFLLGSVLFKQLLVRKDEKHIDVDSYTPVSLLFFLYLYRYEFDFVWLYAVPGLLIAAVLFLIKTKLPREWSLVTTTVAVVFLIQPYYSVMLKLDLPSIWEREILLLPLLLMMIFIRAAWKNKYDQITSQMQWAVLVMTALLLIQDGLASSTIYDAIILGTLSLVSILVGVFFRIKSYFLVGTGVLLLNVILQTRPYWGNMPWWAYLLIGGSILIIVASSNEWHKQKVAKGEATYFSKLMEKFIRKWKEWS